MGEHSRILRHRRGFPDGVPVLLENRVGEEYRDVEPGPAHDDARMQEKVQA